MLFCSSLCASFHFPGKYAFPAPFAFFPIFFFVEKKLMLKLALLKLFQHFFFVQLRIFRLFFYEKIPFAYWTVCFERTLVMLMMIGLLMKNFFLRLWFILWIPFNFLRPKKGYLFFGGGGNNSRLFDLWHFPSNQNDLMADWIFHSPFWLKIRWMDWNY